MVIIGTQCKHGKDKNYHLNKTLECEKNGYRLIHIFEYEWINKQEIIKSKLKSLFGVEQERIYARKCIIKEIDSNTKNIFLNRYHIQGEDKSKVKLGLFYKDELVAVMTFGKPRFNKNYEWELIRYATSKHVIGGASKLLKYFERNFNPNSIITYADRRFSQGNMYYKLGFTLKMLSSPGYSWISDEHLMYLNRLNCFKSNVKKMFDDYDESLSIRENLINHGFYQLFDCRKFCFCEGKIND